MTQILCGISPEGIMVATDSMATAFGPEAREHHFQVDKLFAVGSHAFIVSGGLGISVELSRRFGQYAEERRLLGIEAIKAAAGAYLSGRYAEVLRSGSRGIGPPDRLDRVYFVLGGHSFRDRENPYQIALWGSESGRLPLERLEVGPCLAVPRSLTGEARLCRLCREKRPLDEFIDFARAFLQRQAEADPQVGPPFRFGTVTPAGFRRLRA
jgi:hypothetical protein